MRCMLPASMAGWKRTIWRAAPSCRRSMDAWMRNSTSLPDKSVELNSVNGSLDLTIPSDSNAEVEASTVSGNINNDFGLHVNNHRFVGHDLTRRTGQRRHAHQVVECEWQN